MRNVPPGQERDQIMKTMRGILTQLIWVGLFSASLLHGAETGAMRVGAAKADISPPESILPYEQTQLGKIVPELSFVSVHDKLYARAIVVDNGSSVAAIVALELVKVPKPEEVIRKISAATGIAPERIVLAAVHTHAEPLTSPEGREASPKWAAYFDKIASGAVEAVRLAKERLQPARMGYGAGRANINNYSGVAPGSVDSLGSGYPSDKTVAVIKFESLSGEPIAILLNYALGGEVVFRYRTRKDGCEVTSDFPGAASTYVENHYKNKVVALYTMGAAGDQSVQFRARDTQPEIAPPVDESGGAWAILNALSRRLGDEVVRVADAITQTTTTAKIWGAANNLTCPGQKATGTAGATEYEKKDTGPVELHLGLLMINDIALATVGGELATSIGQRVQRDGSFTKTLLVTQAGGNLGYIVEDAAYERFSHSVGGSPFKPGCAEKGIPAALTDLSQRYVAGAP